jgi:tRNA(Ile)-lysidine synthase
MPVVLQRIDLSSWQQKHRGSLQMAARTLRYQCLHQVMTEEGASKLALGHNADDQAEEVLLRIFRGAGQRGLTGMPARNRDGVIRPLLECYRHEIIAYLKSHGLDFRQDASNLKPWCQRNLLRLELLPRLRQKFNSNLSATLLRTSRIFQEEEDFWKSLLESWLKRHATGRGTDAIRFPVAPLLETHPAMQKRLLRRVVEEVKGDLRGFGFHHTEILMQLCLSPAANSQIDLPGGLLAEKNYGWLTLTMRQDPLAGFIYEIPGPDAYPFPLLDHSMEVQFVDSDLPPTFSADPNEVVMDLDQVSFPLTLRPIKVGDRIRPLGLGGTKKVKDLFIDLKVPRSQRRRIPILCSKDHIIWVVGYRLDDRVKVTPSTSRLLRLRYRKGTDSTQ